MIRHGRDTQHRRAPGALALLFGLPSIGIVAGGTLAGALATRIGPAATLAAGTALGTLGTTGMFIGAVAVCCSFLLSLTAGTLVTSGFNMAGLLAPTERQDIVAGLVMIMTAIGSVVPNFVGTAVLRSTNVIVDGSTENSAGGVHTYIAVATGAVVAAAVVAVILVHQQHHTNIRSIDRVA